MAIETDTSWTQEPDARQRASRRRGAVGTTWAAVAGTALFVALAALEVHHDLVRRIAWPGYTLLANNVVFLVAPFWVLGAISVWVRRPWAWAGMLAGIAVSLVHGAGVLVGGSRLGLLFLGAAPLLLVLCWAARRPSPSDALGGVEEPARERARTR
jgi:hypothetical protein